MYARYIPPIKNTGSLKGSQTTSNLRYEGPSAPRVQFDKPEVEQVQQPAQSPPSHHSLPTEYEIEAKKKTPGSIKLNDSKKPKKEKLKRKRHVEGEEQNDEPDPKFSGIFAKRQKSIQLAETIKLNEIKDNNNPENQERTQVPDKVHDLAPMPQPPQVVPDQSVPTYSTLPAWLETPHKVPSDLKVTFEQLGLDAETCNFLRSSQLSDPFPIQAVSATLLPPIEASRTRFSPDCRDVLISAETGSGKTFAYVLPMVRDLYQFADTSLRGVVIVPTRELVGQVSKVLDLCNKAFSHKGKKRLRIGTAVGNKELAKEHLEFVSRREEYVSWDYKCESTIQDRYAKINKLARERFGADPPRRGYEYRYKSNIDIIIATPDRLFEHILFSKGFILDECRWLILDEADKLLFDHNSFDRIMMRLSLSKDPDKTTHLRKVIVGATLTRDLSLLSSLKLRQPVMAVVESDGKTVNLPHSLEEKYIKVSREDMKPVYLLDLLDKIYESERDEASDDTSLSSSSFSHQEHTTLIFVRDNLNVSRLRFLLSELAPKFGAKMGTLTSKMQTIERRRVIYALKSRIIPIVIASDLVARGLDVEGLTDVVNYDVPNSVASYVHRVGRTARAGRSGSAWSLVTGKEMPWFRREVLGQEDGKRTRKAENGLRIARAKEVERIFVPSNQGISKERQKEYEAALAQLADAVHGES